MTTETEQPCAEQGGFTLIEVLVAMLILAVGLLGLEALGVGAARSLAQADDRGELVAAATGGMEEAQQQLRAELLTPPSTVTTGESCADAGGGVTVCTDVQTRATLGTLAARNARVTVTASSGDSAPERFSITSYVFDPTLP